MINWYLFSSGVFMNFCKIWSSCHLRRISRLGSDSLNTLINGMISGKVAALIFSWRMSVKFLMVFADRLIEGKCLFGFLQLSNIPRPSWPSDVQMQMQNSKLITHHCGFVPLFFCAAKYICTQKCFNNREFQMWDQGGTTCSELQSFQFVRTFEDS